MSESLCFQVFYELGEVRYGPQGIDLSEFKAITKVVPRARERTWGQFANGYLRLFVLMKRNMSCPSWQ